MAANFKDIIGTAFCKDYSEAFARRAMADLAFTDHDGNYYIIDVKTHRKSTKFNMPNLTSVERITRFYEDDRNYFVVLLFPYDIIEESIQIDPPKFIPIEYLSWNCLTLGALGWGQIQIANSNKIELIHGGNRKAWMLQLFDELLEFYPKELTKINKRIAHFMKLREAWEQRP